MAEVKRPKAVCIDCWAEWSLVFWAWDDRRLSQRPDVFPDLWDFENPEPKLPKRDAKHPGPRCATHHRVKLKAQKARRRDDRGQKVYNQEPGTYELLLAFQGGTCAIPKCRAKGLSRSLAWDHDHTCCPGPVSCGQCIRGLLCKRHNLLLGMEGDDIEVFLGIIEYLTNPPYQKMRQG